MNRFQQQNTALESLKSGEQRIVLMGNSITERWEHLHPEYFVDKPYVNRGISGQTTPQMLLRFRQDVIDIEATIVVILAGINDIAGNTGPSTIEMISNNIISMVQLARVNDIKVILCSLLPAIDFRWNPGLEPAPKIIALNAILKSYAEENDLVYVDYYSAMVDASNGLKKELGNDGVHPNLDGYRIMESILEAGIAETNVK